MSTITALKLSEFLPFRLSVLSNTISEQIANSYRRHFDLTVPQWRIIAVLEQHPGLTATAVSNKTVMDKVAVSRAVSALIEMGRIERRARQDDGRSSALFLTVEGQRIYNEVAPLAHDFEAALLAKLTEDERQQLQQILTKIAEAASPDRDLW